MKKFIAMLLTLMMVLACFAGCSAANKKTIVVGYTIYEPMNYFDADGKLIGYDT